MVEGFDENYRGAVAEPLLYPASKYANPDILQDLTRLPASEQPSRGWKWFCHEYGIHSLGIVQSETLDDAGIWSIMYNIILGPRAVRELNWGYPFWSKERLEMWGVIVSSEKAEKKNEKRGGGELQGENRG